MVVVLKAVLLHAKRTVRVSGMVCTKKVIWKLSFPMVTHWDKKCALEQYNFSIHSSLMLLVKYMPVTVWETGRIFTCAPSRTSAVPLDTIMNVTKYEWRE